MGNNYRLDSLSSPRATASESRRTNVSENPSVEYTTCTEFHDIHNVYIVCTIVKKACKSLCARSSFNDALRIQIYSKDKHDAN